MTRRLHPLLIAFALLVLAGLCPPARGQDEPIAGFEGMAEVTEVLLDVLAVDGSGEVVKGLGKEDFLVEEDGEAMEITSVSFYTTRYEAGSGQFDVEGVVPSSRFFILFFHDQVSSGSIGNYFQRQKLKARRGCLTWVEEHLLPSDWVAVASYDLRLKLHQDFTQDRVALVEAIKNATTRRDPEKGLRRGVRALPPSGMPSLLRHLPQGKALRRESRNLYDGLRLLAESAGFVVGRKNLLMFSAGFGELEAGRLLPEADPRFYRPMVHALNDHNVAVYPIDLTPVEVRHLQGHLLLRLAAATGGLYLRSFVNFLTPLQQISLENAGYYLISYRRQHPTTAGYQEVKVRAHDRKLRLRARQGYRYGN